MGSDQFDRRLMSALDPRKKGHGVDTEALMVKRIARTVGLSQTRIKSECRKDGLSRPTLAWFCRGYQSFPLFLGYRQTKHARDGLREMSRNFLKSAIFQSWQAIEDANDTGKPTGCFFRWPRFGDCIVYRDDHFNDRDTGVAVVIRLKTGQLFVVRHVKDWLKSVSWRPEGSSD